MNSLADFIIRPKRAEYNPDKDLGPKQFFLNSKPKQRIDFEVVNDFSLKLKCSIFAPATIKGQYPCVVYCHGNSACRTEALEAVDLLVPHDILVVAFDFSGSGVSEGKYVTLGFNEQDDLKCVVNHLRTLKYISEIGLWGRSMGAATCIMYAAKDPNIAAMCLDSGFTNLVQLCTDTLKNRTLGSFLGGMLLGSVRKAIKKKANFELEDVSPINCLSHCKMPAVFLHGTKDDIVPISHSRKLFSEYPGNSKIHELNLSHNDPRPKWIRHEVRSFFVHKFTEAKKKKEFNEHLTSILNIKLNDPNTDHHKLEEFMHRMTYHESENSARSSQKDTQNEPHTQRDYGGFDETDRPAPEPINARNLTHKFSVGNIHPDPQLMKMLRQVAPKISTTDSDESEDDEPATMIKKISATPKWNAFGKIPPLINMPKKVYLSKARHLEENYTQMPRGYHSKMASHEYSSDGEM